MNYDRITMGRLAKEQGFVRDTLEKGCRLTDILLFIQQDEYLHGRLALKGGTAINLTVLICLASPLTLTWTIPVTSAGTLCWTNVGKSVIVSANI